jgi:flagellar hook-associated protein 1 FlgK
MGNLLTSLLNTANALGVYGQALQTTENNVLNASTPAYAKQVQVLTALPYDPTIGMPGGVAAGPILSTRSGYAEQAVRGQQSVLGFQQQIATDLTPLQSYFDISSTSGISSAMNGLFNSFSQLSVNPNDTVSRQAVLDQASMVASSFQHTAAGLGSASSAIDDETRSAVSAVNRISGQIAQINSQQHSAVLGADAGVDASLNASLEELSQYVDFKALQQPDGSVTVYMGGQTPLVMGNSSMPLQADFSSPQTKILDATGKDVTSQIQSGKLGGMLQTKNTALPSFMADLNTLAQSFADHVNTSLAQGIDQSGAAPTTDLFSYNLTSGAASSMSVNALTPDQIAAALPEAPSGNGNALNLAQLVNAKPVNGYSFAQYYGAAAGRVGRELSNATDDTITNQQLLAQAQTMRSNLSSVSLDEEASHLIAFQRAYQATSKLLSVLNDLTATVINIIP